MHSLGLVSWELALSGNSQPGERDSDGFRLEGTGMGGDSNADLLAFLIPSLLLVVLC